MLVQPPGPAQELLGWGCDAGGAAGSTAARQGNRRLKSSCALQVPAISLLLKWGSPWFPALCHPASVKAHGFPWCSSLKYLMAGGKAVLRNASVLQSKQKVVLGGRSRQEEALAVIFQDPSAIEGGGSMMTQGRGKRRGVLDAQRE